MPRMDGTGPMGLGPMAGRGLGLCNGSNTVKNNKSYGLGLGLGYRHGMDRDLRRMYPVNEISDKAPKELLQEQKELLESRLQIIEKQLDNM